MFPMKHGTKTYTLDFTDHERSFGRTWTNSVFLSDLLMQASSLTGVAVENIKLLSSGGKKNSYLESLFFSLQESGSYGFIWLILA